MRRSPAERSHPAISLPRRQRLTRPQSLQLRPPQSQAQRRLHQSQVRRSQQLPSPVLQSPRQRKLHRLQRPRLPRRLPLLQLSQVRSRAHRRRLRRLHRSPRQTQRLSQHRSRAASARLRVTPCLVRCRSQAAPAAWPTTRSPLAVPVATVQDLVRAVPRAHVLATSQAITVVARAADAQARVKATSVKARGRAGDAAHRRP